VIQFAHPAYLWGLFAVALPITPVCGQHRSAWPTSACIQRPALRNPQFLNSTP